MDAKANNVAVLLDRLASVANARQLSRLRSWPG